MSDRKEHKSEGGTLHGMDVNARILKITGWLTGIYFLIELGLGFYSRSVAVISDAFHTFSAVGGILIALAANKIATKHADRRATFGFKRAEIVGALLNGIFLFLMAIYVLYMGYNRLKMTFELPTGIMFLSAFGGIVTELISFKLMFKQQKENINMKGAFWHILQTFVGSILIIVAAIVINLTGFTKIDPILGMAFGLVLLWASTRIIKDALTIFMEKVPADIDIEKIKKDLLAINGVESVRHIHAWELSSDRKIFSAHLQIRDHKKGEGILREAEKILREKYGFYFSTLQLEEEHIETEADEIDVNL